MDNNKLFKSPLHLKIIKFFHENQSAVDTPRGVATWIGEDRAKVKSALEDLVKHKILVADRTASTTGYGYTRDIALISRIKKTLASLG